MKNLQVTFNNVENNQPLTISLAGTLTINNAMNFKHDLLNIVRGLEKDCYIDITSLFKIDENGLNALMSAKRNLEMTGNKLYILSTDSNKLNTILTAEPMRQEIAA